MSRPIQPSGMLSTETILVLASAANLSATTTSVGSRIFTPRLAALAISVLARSTLSSSTSEAPVFLPMAL